MTMVMGKLPEFEYSEPSSVHEAFEILRRNPGAMVLAGGTDLILSMRQREIKPTQLVNIKRIPGLDRIQIDEKGGLRIGALTTIGAIENSELIQDAFPVLADAAHHLGSFQIRHRATLGGNLCNASPCADTAAPLIALGAFAKIAGPRGERMVKLEEFFVGPGETVLSRDEILTEVQVPKPERDSYGAFLKHGPRNAMDIATVNAALMVTMREKTCLDARIVLGSVAPVPMRARKAEAAICGKSVDEREVASVAEIASSECSPISDVRGSADYRRAIVKVMVGRLFQKAVPPRLFMS